MGVAGSWASRLRLPACLLWVGFQSLASGCGSDSDIAVMPVADAGFDQEVQLGAAVSLDGSLSHAADGASLTYTWSMVAAPDGSQASLAGANTKAPSFSPDVTGYYVAELIVHSSGRDSRPDVVAVLVSNLGPVADAQCEAGSGCEVLHDHVARLDGRGSYDPDSAALTYSWGQITDPTMCASDCPNLASCDASSMAVTITGRTSDVAEFTAPSAQDELLVFQLTVSDGSLSTSACIAYMTINTPPIIAAVSVSAVAVDEGDVFTLTSNTGDSEGDALTYLWEQVAPATPPVAVLDTADQANTTATAPEVTTDTVFSFRLTISDGFDTVAHDDVLAGLLEVTVRNIN